MDRLDAMRAFIAALDEGSLAAAGRKLNKSPAAMTRALASIEAEMGGALFERTTRIVRLTPAGEHYANVARRILADFDSIMNLDVSERVAPSGQLTITAPISAGIEILRPVIDAFLDSYPQVDVQLLLFDRPANLIDEGIDVALRIAHLPDSDLVASQVGQVRRVVCAAPSYLARHGPIVVPADLAAHQVITLAETRQVRHWTFPARSGSTRGRSVKLSARVSVNNIEAARRWAVEGRGIARLISYQIADDVRHGRLVPILTDCEPTPTPVHLVSPRGRLAIAKTRAFIDFAVPRLRTAFRAAANLTDQI